ncbi:unnamed protein product, partial [Effrenium voratum]
MAQPVSTCWVDESAWTTASQGDSDNSQALGNAGSEAWPDGWPELGEVMEDAAWQVAPGEFPDAWPCVSAQQREGDVEGWDAARTGAFAEPWPAKVGSARGAHLARLEARLDKLRKAPTRETCMRLRDFAAAQRAPRFDQGACSEEVPLLAAVYVTQGSDRSRQSRKKPSQKVPDANIRQRVQCFLDEKLCTTSRMLVDFVSLSNASFLFLVWVKVNQLGIDGVPPYDIAVVPIAFFNVGLSALFQADYFPNERRSVEVYALLWNLMLVLVKVFADRCNITDRDDTILAYRLCAGFSFGDHRKAAAMQVLWGVLQAYKPHIGTMAWDAIVWELQRQMFTIGHMWLLWYGAEYAVTQLSQLIIQNADVNASLEAARAVLASQCDAEAYLSEDLAFQNPSAKLAHILGVGEPQLQQKCILDLLSDADQERFKKFVEASVYNMNNGQRTAAGLTVTLQHPKGPRDVQIYLGSIPAQFGSDRPSHLIALNEVRDLSACEPTEEETPPQQQLQQQPPVSPHAGQSEDTGGMRLNADALAYHTGCHTRSWAYDGGGS